MVLVPPALRESINHLQDKQAASPALMEIFVREGRNKLLVTQVTTNRVIVVLQNVQMKLALEERRLIQMII